MLIMLSDKTSGQAYNVSAGEAQKIRFYTEKLIELSGLKDVSFEIESKFWRPIDIDYQDGDSTKLINELGWKPQYTIDQTLSDLLQYWVKKLSN